MPSPLGTKGLNPPMKKDKKKETLRLKKEADQALERADWPLLANRSLKGIQNDPNCVWARRYLPFAQAKLGKDKEAEESYKNFTKTGPVDYELQINFAAWLLEKARPDEASSFLLEIVKHFPEKPWPWILLSTAYYPMRKYDLGLECAEKALIHANTTLEKSLSFQQRAIHRREVGQIKEAVADCEEGILLDSNNLGHHTNRLLFMLSLTDLRDEDFLNAALDYSRAAEDPWLKDIQTFADNERIYNKKLKIGFISPDFRNHSVMYFIEGLIHRLDRDHFEVHAIHIHPTVDSITQRVMVACDKFHHLPISSVDLLTEKIRSIKLDIAIDLAGHTGNNALASFARKIAPVQVSTLGFPGTTGLKSMDYKITDIITDPENADKFFTEELVRLNPFFCVYRPSIRNPIYRYQPAYSVKEAPCLRNGYITFGSCTNMSRLNDDVLTTWGRILSLVSESRILIEGKDITSASFSANFLDRCSKAGLDKDRIDLIEMDSRNQYLTYHDIDIVLDPFPLNSGTTSFDCLWMGVPFISLIGQNFRGRIGTGILSTIGLHKYLANTKDEYIRTAVETATNLDDLSRSRMEMRQRIERSALMNETLYATTFGRALRVMWSKYCGLDGSDDFAKSVKFSSLVSISSGQKISLSDAHRQLEALVQEAKSTHKSQFFQRVNISDEKWIKVQGLCEAILNACTNDPVALTCLAEIEHAHGHTDFAVHYMNHAMESLKTLQ
jgi:protein O-GlcNAc transferase